MAVTTEQTGLSWIGQLWNDLSGKSSADTIAYERQKEMAKNQYQWAIQDMEAAGLNPAMMYQSGGNGNTAPSAPNGQGSHSINVIGSISGLMNSITNAVRAKEIDSKVADAMYQNAQSMAKNAQTNANRLNLDTKKYFWG